MSAAGSASSQVRHAAAAAPSHPVPNHQAAARPAMRPAPAYAFVSSDVDDEFKLNLGDIPRFREAMDVEGLKPSLLSRLLEFVAPASKA